MQISLFGNEYAGLAGFFRVNGIKPDACRQARHKALVQSVLFRMGRPGMGLAP